MLRFDPHLAVFRIAPDRVAIGAQHRLATLDTDPPTLRAIAALTRGVLLQELEQLLGEEPAEALLSSVRPALTEAHPPVPTLVRGRIRLAEQLHRAARDAGHPAGDDGVIVPVAPWRLPAAESERLLTSASAHLPVVVGDAWVQVGPFVPAGGGCVQCTRPKEVTVLPAHRPVEPSAIAAAQASLSVLGALRRASEGSLPEGWGVRIRQRDAAVSALRRRRPCAHRRGARGDGPAERSPRGTAMAA